ncbi:MAG: DUF3857 domain-containing protein [Deltaproteobacteria bacterium]|nr:DUF3857 domain-containing protein [Deltaproteobacteria bacterium]
MSKKVFIGLFLQLILIISGCSNVVKVSLKYPSDPAQIENLNNIAEKYYKAESPKEMVALVNDAKNINADSAVYHELAADIAYLTGNRHERFIHLANALAHSENDAFETLINELYDMSWTYDETLTAEALFDEIYRNHPSLEARALAGHFLSMMYHSRGKLEEAAKIKNSIGWTVPFAVIGTWDNKQGKGFDVSYPPEDEIDLKAVYPGQNVDVKWRTNPLRGLQNEIDLSEQMYPNTSAVAYAASGIKTAVAGDYNLNITSADAIKVWVNSRLVFTDRRVSNWNFDALNIPVKLNKGVNRIVIKTVHESGSWDLYARVTGVDNKVIKPGVLTSVPADSPFVKDDSNLPPYTIEQMVDDSVKGMRVNSARTDYYKVQEATRIGIDTLRTTICENMTKSWQNSLKVRLEMTFALWDSQERGRTSDLLAGLVEDAGDDFVVLRLKQIRFWRQNDLDKKAREESLRLKDKYSNNSTVLMAVVDTYGSEGWTEDECHLLEDINNKWPGWITASYSLAECYGDLGFDKKEKKIFDNITKFFPYDYSLLSKEVGYALAKRNYKKGEKLILDMIHAWPEKKALWGSLANIYLSIGDTVKAKAALEKQIAISPDAPESYSSVASILYYKKDKKSALAYWRKSLERNPNNGALSERLAFLSPQKQDVWEKDAPDEDELDAAVALRDNIKFEGGSDVALLLDHSVTSLAPDGSSININTAVIHSLNVSGRDSITEYNIPCYGFSRILHAYSVDPSGKKSDASSIRGKTIRFRQLEVGSTVVVQNRCEQSADELIGDYFSATWSFQSFNKQFVDSRYILWAPADVKINEFSRGEITKTEKTEGNLKRYEWKVENSPVLKGEISMPSTIDIAWYLQLSTVPSWELFLKWEDSLLQDVFRNTPELIDLAQEITKDKKSVIEKLFAIQDYIATKIRYQQDYENYVAGVKPHTASQVIARGYGDCKDKSVLFITLAKLSGITAQFSLVRTRSFGQIIQEVPSQQFNHAIVYVPAQEGLAEGRFFDATTDALDVDVMRSDDVGTMALVFDREKMVSNWIEIPYQDISMNSGMETLTGELSDDGSIKGSLALDFKGRLAAVLRQTFRNQEKFKKVLQFVIDALINGSTLIESEHPDIADINKNVLLNVEFESKTFGRVQDKELRFKIPFDARPEKLFALEKREYPLVLGIPNTSRWGMTFKIPEKSKISKIPLPFVIDTPCISFSRKVDQEKGKNPAVTVVQTLDYKCERISPEDYPLYRDEIQKLRNALDEDVTIKLK